MNKGTLLLGHSPDPDDAFMFYALAQGKVDTGGWCFEHVLQDIQTLNERALRGELHITAVSIHAYPYVAERYALTACGSSMGDGYGPLLGHPPLQLGDILGAVLRQVDGVQAKGGIEQRFGPAQLQQPRPAAGMDTRHHDGTQPLFPAMGQDDLPVGLKILHIQVAMGVDQLHGVIVTPAPGRKLVYSPLRPYLMLWAYIFNS